MSTRSPDHTVNTLRPRVADAIGELAELRSRDPAATSAVHAIVLTQRTLEDFWEPALAAIETAGSDD